MLVRSQTVERMQDCRSTVTFVRNRSRRDLEKVAVAASDTGHGGAEVAAAAGVAAAVVALDRTAAVGDGTAADSGEGATGTGATTRATAPTTGNRPRDEAVAGTTAPGSGDTGARPRGAGMTRGTSGNAPRKRRRRGERAKERSARAPKSVPIRTADKTRRR